MKVDLYLEPSVLNINLAYLNGLCECKTHPVDFYFNTERRILPNTEFYQGFQCEAPIFELSPLFGFIELSSCFECYQCFIVYS